MLIPALALALASFCGGKTDKCCWHDARVIVDLKCSSKGKNDTIVKLGNVFDAWGPVRLLSVWLFLN